MNDGEPDYEWDAGFEAGYRTAMEEHDTAVSALVEAARYVADWDGDPTRDIGIDRLATALKSFQSTPEAR